MQNLLKAIRYTILETSEDVLKVANAKLVGIYEFDDGIIMAFEDTKKYYFFGYGVTGHSDENDDYYGILGEEEYNQYFQGAEGIEALSRLGINVPSLVKLKELFIKQKSLGVESMKAAKAIEFLIKDIKESKTYCKNK